MEVIIKPILTEKMTIQGEKLNRYGFIVDVRANKLQIRNAVEQMYNVVVTDVNTINCMGKLKRQKGTGGARCGSIKSPLFPGGGRIFGPVPRDYSFKLNKKLKRLARRSALTYKAQANAITVVENLAFEAPKTKAVVALAEALKVADKKVLVVLPETNVNLQLSCRNLPYVKTILASSLNTYEVMNASALVMVEGAENVLNVMLA